MKIVVTGGAGQLGTLVLRRLLANRKVKRVVSIDLRPPILPLGRLEHVAADIRDPEIGRHLEGADALIHLAFVVTGYLPRAEFDAINVGGSKNVIRAALAAGVPTIVYSSSIAAFGVVPGHPVPLVETSPRVPNPDFAYAAAKQAVEDFLDEIEPQHPDVAIARLRPAILIGKRIENALGALLRAGFVPDDRAGKAPIVWDEDVADATILAMNRRARGAFILAADDASPRDAGFRRFPLPRGVVYAFSRAAASLNRARGKPATDPVWSKPADDITFILSSEKARNELGWKPSCPTAVDVLRRLRAEAPRRLDPRLRLFFAFAAAASRRRVPEEHRHIAARIHLELTGPTGGDLGLVLDDGRLTVTTKAPRPPTSVVRLAAPTLRRLLSGDADVGTVQLTGQLQVEGEPSGGMLLSAIVNTFRAQRGRAGADGLVARTLSYWLKEAA
jgi:UDP-glucose 4-epimerase